MHFNPWTFLFEIVNFVVLAAVLYRLLYRPLHEAIDRRRSAVERAQTEADKAREQATALQQQVQAQLAEMQQQCENVLLESRQRAEAERKKTFAEGEAELQRRREQAQQALEREREQAWQSLRGEMTRLALEVVQRLLRESSERTLNDQLALHLLEELRSLPPEKRQAVRDPWQPQDGAVLESAGPLDDAIVRQIMEVVGELLNRPICLTPVTVATLLAGVRLRLGGHVWDASLAGQLEPSRPVQMKENVTCLTASSN